MAKIGGVIDETLPQLRNPTRRLSTGFVALEIAWQDDPEKTEAWADEEAAPYGGRQAAWWLQNMERVVTRGGQPVWPMLSADIHIRPFSRAERESGSWAVWRILDHGVRHATCCAWVAVHQDEHGSESYVFFRQYYRTDTPLEMNARNIMAESPPDEHVFGTVADPSMWQRNPKDLERFADVYAKVGLPLVQADHALEVGVERVTAGLVATIARLAVWKQDLDILRGPLRAPSLTMGMAERLATGPAVWFTPETSSGRQSLFEQCRNWRYRDWATERLNAAAPEKYIDLDDEGPDVVRYALQSKVVQFAKQPAPKRTKDMLTRIIEAKQVKPSQFT